MKEGSKTVQINQSRQSVGAEPWVAPLPLLVRLGGLLPGVLLLGPGGHRRAQGQGWQQGGGGEEQEGQGREESGGEEEETPGTHAGGD